MVADGIDIIVTCYVLRMTDGSDGKGRGERKGRRVVKQEKRREEVEVEVEVEYSVLM